MASGFSVPLFVRPFVVSHFGVRQSPLCNQSEKKNKTRIRFMIPDNIEQEIATLPSAYIIYHSIESMKGSS